MKTKIKSSPGPSEYKSCCCDSDGDSFCDLHAAAPALLGAVKHALCIFELRVSPRSMTLDKLRAAIAKAEGREVR